MTNKNKTAKEVLKKVPPSKRPDIPNTGCIRKDGIVYFGDKEYDDIDEEIKETMIWFIKLFIKVLGMCCTFIMLIMFFD